MLRRTGKTAMTSTQNDALPKTNESLRKPHETIGETLKLTANLAGFS
jgi:hypothetical protein